MQYTYYYDNLNVSESALVIDKQKKKNTFPTRNIYHKYNILYAIIVFRF